MAATPSPSQPKKKAREPLSQADREKAIPDPPIPTPDADLWSAGFERGRLAAAEANPGDSVALHGSSIRLAHGASNRHTITLEEWQIDFILAALDDRINLMDRWMAESHVAARASIMRSRLHFEATILDVARQAKLVNEDATAQPVNTYSAKAVV